MNLFSDRPVFLITVSGLFVVAGTAMWIVEPAEWQLPLITILFFGACAVTGILQLVLSRDGAPPGAPALHQALLLGLAVILGAVCGLVLWWELKGDSPIGGGPGLIIVSAIGLVFFGIGGVVGLAVHLFRRRRSRP